MTVEKTNLPRMRTIREVARLGILSEHCLRQMQKQKEINRQARRIKELEKKLNEKENATDE